MRPSKLIVQLTLCFSILTFMADPAFSCIVNKNASNVYPAGIWTTAPKDNPEEVPPEGVAEEQCKDWANLMNFGFKDWEKTLNPAQAAVSKRFFCDKGLTTVVEWNGKFHREILVYEAYFVFGDWGLFVLSLMDQFTFPSLPSELNKDSNLGDPNCSPDCEVGENVNALTGNAYYRNSVRMSMGLDFMLSYNSQNGKWNTSLSTNLQTFEATDDYPEIKSVVDERGRAHPILGYNSFWSCSAAGVRAIQDPYTHEFEVAMADRVLKFLNDGRIKSQINRITGSEMEFSYDDAIHQITVRDLSTEKSYEADLDSQDRPTSISLQDSNGTMNMLMQWDPTSSNLVSQTVSGETVNYLYTDPRFPDAVTRIIKPNGETIFYSYDEEKRVIRSGRKSSTGEESNVTTINYDFVSNAEPFVRVIDNRGRVTDRYYQEFVGVKKVVKMVEYANGSPYVSMERVFNKQGFVIEETNAAGVKKIYTRDGFGRVLTQVDAHGTPVARTTTTKWNDNCNLPHSVKKEGVRTTTYTYDSNCRLNSTSVQAL